MFQKIKDSILELNRIQDSIELIKWNSDDEFKCANFNSVEEMNEFKEQVLNRNFDFIFSKEDIENINNTSNDFVDSYKHTFENFDFFIYTYKDMCDNYITYLSITNTEDDDMLDKLYGYKTDNENESHNYFKKLKDKLCNDTLDNILENIVIDINDNIENLNKELIELVNES